MKTIIKTIFAALTITLFASFAYGEGAPAETPKDGNHCAGERTPGKDYTCTASDVQEGNKGCSSEGQVIKGADVD